MSIFFKNVAALLCAILLTTIAPNISSAAPLKISHSASMPPLSFINEDGKADGMLIDLWKEWAKQSGTDIIFELSNWKQAIDSTVNGKTHINGGLFYSDLRADRLIYGDELFPMKGSIFAANSIIYKDSVNMQETICGVLKGGYCKIYMEKNYPYTPMMLFNSIEELFNTIKAGRIKLFVADYPVAIYQLNRYGLEESFTNIKTLYSQALSPAVGKKNSELIQYINKHMSAIPKAKKQKIISKWLNVHDEKLVSPKAIAIFSFIVFLMLFCAHLPELKRHIKLTK